jgi:hypothetical protein
VDKANLIRFVHLPKHAGDLPDFELAVRSLV